MMLLFLAHRDIVCKTTSADVHNLLAYFRLLIVISMYLVAQFDLVFVD